MSSSSGGGSVGGVKFTITVDTAEAAPRIKKVSTELKQLDKTAAALAKRLQAVVARLTEIGAARTGGLRNMSTQLQMVDKYAKEVAKSTRKVADNALRAAKAHTTASKAANVHARSLDTYTDRSMGALHAATSLAGILGTRFLTHNMLDAAKLAARVDVLGTTLEQVGGHAHYSRGELAILEGQVKALGITSQSARESLAMLVRNELDMGKAAKLARVAQDSAVLAGENSSESFSRIATSIEKLEPRLLKAIGINVRLEHAYSAQATALGKTVKSLTERERKEAVLNAVLAKGVTLTGLYEASMGDVGKQLTSLPRLIEEAKKEFGEEFLPVLQDGVNVVGDLAKWYAELPEPVKTASAAIAAGGTVAVGATASVMGLTWALTAMSGALLATPVGWVSLALAAIAGGYVAIQATASDAKREVEELNKASRAKGAAAASSMDESALESHVNNLIRKQEALAKLRRHIAETARDSAGDSWGVSYVTGSAIVLQMTRQIELVGQELTAIKEAQEAIEMRRLDAIIEQQTQAYATAIDIEKDLHQERRDALVGSTMEIIDEFQKQRKELENSVASLEDIQKAYDLAKLKAMTSLNKKYAAKREEAGDDEGAKRRVEIEYTAELLELEQQLAQARDAEVTKRNQILWGLRESVKLAETRLKAEERSLALRRELLDADEDGGIEKVIELEAERLEKLREQKEALKELQELRQSSNDPSESQVYSDRIKQIIEDMKLTQEEAIKEQIDLIEESADQRKETMERLHGDLFKIESDITSMTLEEIEKRRVEREKDFEQTEAFIRRIQTLLMENKNPGRKGLTDQLSDFLEAIGNAGNGAQLEKLMEAFPQVMRLKMQDMEKEAVTIQQKIAKRAAKARMAFMQGDRAAPVQYMIDTAKDRFRLAQIAAQMRDGFNFARQLREQVEQAAEARRAELAGIEKIKAAEDKVRTEKANEIKKEMTLQQNGVQWEQQKLDILKQQLDVVREMNNWREPTGGDLPVIPPPAPGFADGGGVPQNVVKVTPTASPAPNAAPDFPTRPKKPLSRLEQLRQTYEQQKAAKRQAYLQRMGRFEFQQFGPRMQMPVAPTPVAPTQPPVDTSAAASGIGEMGTAASEGFGVQGEGMNTLADVAKEHADDIRQSQTAAKAANEKARRIQSQYS